MTVKEQLRIGLVPSQKIASTKTTKRGGSQMNTPMMPTTTPRRKMLIVTLLVNVANTIQSEYS